MEDVGLVGKRISRNNLQIILFSKARTFLTSIENVLIQHTSYLGKESKLGTKNLNNHCHQNLIKIVKNRSCSMHLKKFRGSLPLDHPRTLCGPHHVGYRINSSSLTGSNHEGINSVKFFQNLATPFEEILSDVDLPFE